MDWVVGIVYIVFGFGLDGSGDGYIRMYVGTHSSFLQCLFGIS